jgi:hypothetical protein
LASGITGFNNAGSMATEVPASAKTQNPVVRRFMIAFKSLPKFILPMKDAGMRRLLQEAVIFSIDFRRVYTQGWGPG